MAAQVPQLGSLLENDAALQKITVRFNRAIDEALDAYCAQLKFQDDDSSMPPVLMTFDQMRDSFFPNFERWILLLLGQKGPSLPVTKHRTVAVLIGAAYRAGVDPTKFTEQQWTNVVEFVRRDIARRLGTEWPLSKGKWDGQKGYRAQLEAAYAIVGKPSQ